MNANLLKGKIVASGKKMSTVHSEFKMSKSSLNRKLNGISAFNVQEVKEIKTALSLTEQEINDIFFNQ